MYKTDTLLGRKVIYTDEDEITQDNVLEVLNDAMLIHSINRSEIDYLYKYYRGNQPILKRQKDVRPEICNRIVENRANEIVSFKVGYLMGEPVQYVGRGQVNTDELNTLNNFVFAEDKAAKDKELADWFTICGTSYRMILPDPKDEADESPFEIYTLDPRNAFVVYHSGLGNKPMMGVKYVIKKNGSIVFSIYTRNQYFEVSQPGVFSQNSSNNYKTITRAENHTLGDIPIIEYPANSFRLGAFEIVLPLLDSMNVIASNRIDGVEQFIQALLVLKGIDLEASEFKELRENGGLACPPDGDAYYLTQELNQTQTQTLVDYMYQTVLTICGMPNRNGGSSTSDTGSAVIMRDGWQAAEARAKDTELMFTMSEKKFLRLAIRISNTTRDMNLKLYSIQIRFTRRNYENIQEKSQVLTTMLANDKIHPKLAFEHSGMFIDPDLAYTISAEYADENKVKQLQELEKAAEYETAKAKASAVTEQDDEMPDEQSSDDVSDT